MAHVSPAWRGFLQTTHIIIRHLETPHEVLRVLELLADEIKDALVWARPQLPLAV